MTPNNYPARIELACAFPPGQGLSGACTSLADLPRHWRLANPLFVRTLRDAVRLVVRTRLEQAVGRGHGNRAQRRLSHAR